MSPGLILFLITLLVLIFFIFAAWKASRRSEEKIAALEVQLEEARTQGPSPLADVLPRISDYLRHSVAKPIQEGLEQGGEELRIRADEALAAVEDMEFFVEDRDLELQAQNVHDAVQEVAAEYTEEFDVTVKIRNTDTALRANIAPEAFKDAVYLVLVNAGRFGRGNPVEVSLDSSGNQVVLRIRDHGPGFTEEALRRGTDPFYTTEQGALGMGLAHASRLLREHDGEVRLGNSPRGGGEVELRLPRV